MIGFRFIKKIKQQKLNDFQQKISINKNIENKLKYLFTDYKIKELLGLNLGQL